MNKKRLRQLAILTVMFALMFSMTSYATAVGAGSDATIDILGGERFQGAVQWANKIGKIVDNWFMAFITFVAFFIISASCLRNVLAGAYCVFPKFWDKVDEAHKARESVRNQGYFERVHGFFSGGGWKNAGTGSITEFLLGMLPNVKVLTDFENAQDPDYKQYFMRAIPQCVLAVFVGVFIYNGYYRDVMIVTSQFGSRVTLNALNSIDPDDILYKLSNVSGLPEYGVKGAKEGTDYMADLLVTSMAKAIRSEYQDQSEKDNKTLLYQSLSSVLAKECKEKLMSFNDTSVWAPSAGKAWVVDTARVQESATEGYSNNGMSYQKTFEIPIASLGLNTEYHKDKQNTVLCTLVLTNQGASDSKIDVSEANDWVLVVGTSIKDNSYTLPAGEYGGFKTGGSPAIGDVDVSLERNKITIKGNKNFNSGELYQAHGIYYASQDPSKDFPIAGIKFSEGSDTTLTSANLGVTIEWGGSIQKAVNEKNQTTSPTNTDNSDVDDNEDDSGDDLSDGAK